MPVTLAGFLIAITGSITARVLTSLGIGIFSYAALTSVIGTVVSAVTVNYQAIGAVPLALLNLAGVGQCFGIVLAALTTRASLMAIKTMRPS